MMHSSLIGIALFTALRVSAQSIVEADSLAVLFDTTRVDTVQMDRILTAREAHTGSDIEARLNQRLGALSAALMKSDDSRVQRAGERGHAHFLIARGYELCYRMDLAGAVGQFRGAQEIGRRLGLMEMQQDALMGMATAYFLVHNDVLGRKACRGASDLAWAMGDTMMVIRLAKRTMAPEDADAIGTALLLVDRYATGKPDGERSRIRWQKVGLLSHARRYREALDVARACKDMLDAPDAPPYLAPAYHLTVGYCYARSDSPSVAADHYSHCVSSADEGNAWSWACSCGDSLGDVLLIMGARSAAEQAYLHVLGTAQEHAFTGDIAYASEALLELYRIQGRDKEAWRMQDIWMRARDSLDLTEGREEIAAVEFKQQMLADSLRNAQEQEAAAHLLQKGRDQRTLLLVGGLVAVVFGFFSYRQRRRTQKALVRSDELLLNILPEEVADELKLKGEAQARHFDSVTILFTDFKGFTSVSEQLSPTELVEELNTCFKAFDGIITARGIEKIKTIGDAYMAAGGLPTPNTTHALDVVKAAFEIRDFIAEGKARKLAAGLPYFEIRIGIHTGPVVAGIVGVKKFAYDIWGDTVNTASRMESSGEVGQVNISEATYALVKGEPGLYFTSRGKVQAKGKGEMEMFFVDAA